MTAKNNDVTFRAVKGGKIEVSASGPRTNLKFNGRSGYGFRLSPAERAALSAFCLDSYPFGEIRVGDEGSGPLLLAKKAKVQQEVVTNFYYLHSGHRFMARLSREDARELFE